MAKRARAQNDLSALNVGLVDVPNDLDPVTVDLGLPGSIEDVDGVRITEGADGSSTVDFEPAAVSTVDSTSHNANLAVFMDDSALSELAIELIDAVGKDIESKKDYEAAYINGLELLGLTIEERTFPFKGACGVFDPLLAEAVVRFQATARGELLPAAGPVKSKVIGKETKEIRAQADRVRGFMNYYLTEAAPEYYEDYDQMLFWLPIAGSMFKKVYQDPHLNRPVAPFIMPQDFIVNYTTSSLYKSPRSTHVIRMPKKDMVWCQLKGFYKDVELEDPQDKNMGPAPGKTDATQKAVDKAEGRQPTMPDVGDDRYLVYEISTDRDLKGFEHLTDAGEQSGLPRPYIITLDVNSNKVLSIRRNWKEGDDRFLKKQWFVHYKFFPGPGFYGIGLAHFLGGYAKAATSILRQLVDAGTLNNFPGGVRVKGLRMEDNELGIGPTEFREIETGGLPISQAIMTMPYKEPSMVLKELRSEIVESARRLGSTTDIAVGDGRQDAPVGTTVALLEAATKVESGVIKRCFRSQAQEFKLLAEVFRDHLPQDAQYPYLVEGDDRFVLATDFDDRVDVIPVGDPNIASASQRMIRSEAQLRMAQSAPELHDIREAFYRVYEAMNVPNIDQLMPPPSEAKPSDPLSENQMSMMGQPLKVGIWQDDTAHIETHIQFIEAPGMQAHVAEHMANKYRKAIEQALGRQLPPLGEEMPPEIENEVARLVAEATRVLEDEKLQKEGPDNPLAVAMEEIRVKAAEVQSKMQQAKMKVDADRWEAQLQFQTDAMDRASRERIAIMKQNKPG